MFDQNTLDIFHIFLVITIAGTIFAFAVDKIREKLGFDLNSELESTKFNFIKDKGLLLNIKSQGGDLNIRFIKTHTGENRLIKTVFGKVRTYTFFITDELREDVHFYHLTSLLINNKDVILADKSINLKLDDELVYNILDMSDVLNLDAPKSFINGIAFSNSVLREYFKEAKPIECDNAYKRLCVNKAVA